MVLSESSAPRQWLLQARLMEHRSTTSLLTRLATFIVSLKLFIDLERSRVR
jgi:hypothetical protein